jgi:SAM-dependent methyltransferase
MLDRLVGKVQTAVYLARQWRSSADYMINNDVFWDQYVRVWERTEGWSAQAHVGDEWSGPQRFREVLAKYASKDYEALEIGCGGGRITETAVGLFGRVTATDVSREMLRKASESVKAPNVTFQRISGFSLGELPEGSKDVVYSHDVFVHFSAMQVYPYFLEIKRVLRTGGIGIISFRSYDLNFELFKGAALDLWRRKRFPPHMRNHFVTEEQIRLMLADAGLEVVEIEKQPERFLIAVFRK